MAPIQFQFMCNFLKPFFFISNFHPSPTPARKLDKKIKHFSSIFTSLNIFSGNALWSSFSMTRGLYREFIVLNAFINGFCVFSSSPEDYAEAETGARLSCHLLLRLFKPSYLIAPQNSGVSSSTKTNPPLIRNSCDRHLLEAAHLFIGVGPMLAVLKAMLKLGRS